VKKHPTGIKNWYLYRGVTIKRDDRNRGCWGHWYATIGSIMAGTSQKLVTQTQGHLLAQIDKHLGAIKNETT